MKKDLPFTVVGLTGQTGAGKTTVSDFLREKGVSVVDADIVARKVVEPGSACLTEIAQAFSPTVLQKDGTLNRRKMAAIIFGDPQEKKRYEAIIFPFITHEIQKQLEDIKNKGFSLAVLDAPTLFESGADRLCSEVISVTAPQQLRKHRIMERDGLTAQEAEQRIRSQHPDDYYHSRSTCVVVNDGDLTRLHRQLEALWQQWNFRQNARD